MTDLPLSCRCGKVRGIARVSPGTTNRAICHCVDCQTFVYALDRADVLDENGGTDIGQMSPKELSITEGIEHVACLRLSPNGLMRWHTSCCNTPIGTTRPQLKLPFIGIIHSFVDHSAHDRDAVYGPAARVMMKDATCEKGSVPGNAGYGFGVTAKLLGRMAGWWMGGGKTCQLFVDGEPIVEPRVLTKAERAQYVAG